MWPDVLELRKFYETRLGRIVRRTIRRKLRELWPTVKGRQMIALGYPTPFLRYYREEAAGLVALMPAEQGALSWSGTPPNIVVLTEETQLPLADRSIDFALVVHALEFTANPRPMIRELWRVLAEGGRLIVVVPNRLSIWARLETTPFGQGHPYSISQVTQLLNENSFTPLGAHHALYCPPSHSRFFLSMASAWERIGHRWFPHLSGVLIVEASKQVYAGSLVEEMSWSKKLRLAKKLAQPIKN